MAAKFEVSEKVSYYFFSVSAILVFSLTACNRNAVMLEYTNAKGEVPQLDNLIFRFNKALAGDSLLNQWDSAAFVSFEPAIAGRFRWERPDELVFSPSAPLPPATSFKAKLNREILANSPFNKIGDAENITFHTALLKLENTNVFWVLQDGNSKTPVPQIDLYFNYAVDPAVLKGKLRIEVEGKATNYTIQTLSPANVLSVRLLDVKAADKDFPVKVFLEKGIIPQGGLNGTPEAAEYKSAIPSPFVLTINDVVAEHNGVAGTIMVKTNQAVVSAGLAGYIKIEPASKFSVEATDDGFMISSEAFDQDKAYSLTLKKGLRGIIGGELKEDHISAIAFGKLEPSIQFGNASAVYLSDQGNRNIEVRITNVSRVKVIISKIYQSNLLAAGRYDYYPRESNAGTDYYYEGSGFTPGDVIYEQEIDTRSLPAYGSSRLFNFNIADHLQEFKGVYHIMIRSAEDYWVRDSRFISLSDIGLIVKEARDKLVVFANSVKTATSLEGVNITAYGDNNQVLGIGATNKEGVAEIEYIRKDLAGFRPAMIIASTATDFNYLPFNNTRVNTSRFEVGGRRSNKTGLDAFIYAERDIYRPGEKINYSIIVRDMSWQSPGGIPLKLKFLLPNGRELKTFRKNLNEQGALEGSLDIAAAGITGTYSLEVYTSNDILLSSKPFMIEEFVPDRIKVTTRLDKPFLTPGDVVNLGINAVNFFGPPAVGRNYEAEIQLKQKFFNPKKYPAYHFNLANQNSFFDKIVKTGKTDEAGNASEQYTVPETYKNLGVLQAVFYATVFDETGRPVSRNITTDIYTQAVFPGIGYNGYSYFPLNQPVQFPLIVLDRKEAVVNGASLEVKVVKHEYRTVVAKNGSYFSYQSQRADKLISSQTLTVSGINSAYSFIPRSPGNYEIRVSVPGANSYVSRSFYSYGSWGGDNNSFEVNNEGNIEIEPDKSTYLAGEPVKVLFKTPFSGRMLVTMESDKLISYQYVEVTKRSASVDLKLSAEHLPNVYITATLIKPHTVSDIPLTVAYGFKNIRVEEKNRKIPVEIIAAASVRSHTHQKVTVKAGAGSYVTLAAVDNGVLQVSDFKTPDPYNYFYASRALEVNAYSLYPLLFPELKAIRSSTGGDGDLSMSKRINPVQNKRVKIVSWWSGITRVPASGKVDFEFDVPAFSGEIRLMAVAYNKERFGSQEAAMKVADPVVLSTALPRFLSPADTITVPVTITNTTGKPASGTASLKIGGPLRVVGSSSHTIQLAANAESRVNFQVTALPAIGNGEVQVEVQALGERFREETTISVRPASTLQKLTGGGFIAGGDAGHITIGRSDFIPETVGYSLVVSRSPALELASQLSFLIQYPYGCTEQTISAAFPQLYYGDLSDLLQTNKGSNRSAVSNIQEAIRKIKMRQLYNGAITFWDGEGTENWWATIYAAHFLLEAKKAGYEVDQSLLDPMLAYINGRLRNRESITYYYNRNQQKKIAPKEVAYSLYVLATANRPNISVMNYYKAKPEQLSLDSRYLLSAAYAIAGDKEKFRELLPGNFSGEESVAQTGGSFYSPIRDEAIALNVLIEVDPDNAQIPVMARHLTDQLKQRSRYSTQESAFSFLAIGKLARLSGKSAVTADVKVKGKTVGSVANNAVRFTAKQLNSMEIDITTSGTGRMYYWWESEGISRTGAYRETDSYIKARKQFFDRNGRPVNTNTFRQNELIIVRLTIEKSYSTAIENVVLTDLLPAGFEIENPRTKDIPGMDWIKDASTPTQLDVRDDRINLFIDLHKPKQTYYYAVRAVSPGTYQMGPVSADAMYNGDYHSYHGAGIIKVIP